ncbi:hypothetical protein M413DRAFT_444280 [Hebeloma cylindrosporum]|uniref:Uncharacterized protein n=1 Tax=Hebeloma cylindrosporum TaxID=76867 RepID=A0A0C3C103_HEBCY|nr:hypothetical protein M413DRAFT_444280 [Hebeloma cylindrosporum h7]
MYMATAPQNFDLLGQLDYDHHREAPKPRMMIVKKQSYDIFQLNAKFSHVAVM